MSAAATSMHLIKCYDSNLLLLKIFPSSIPRNKNVRSLFGRMWRSDDAIYSNGITFQIIYMRDVYE
jgi:hypothetical protein